MTRVIKSREAAQLPIRGLDSVWRPEPSPPREDPQLTALRQQCAELFRELQYNREEVGRLQGDVERAFREGEAVGRKLGLAEAEDARAVSLAALEAGVDQALASFRKEVEALERLAPLVAREALRLIVDDEGGRSRLMGDVVRRQIDRLSGQAVVRVEVSRLDFPEPSGIAEKIGRSNLDLRISDELAAGDCRIKLALGSLEVGLHQQWGRLSALLEDLARAEAVT